MKTTLALGILLLSLSLWGQTGVVNGVRGFPQSNASSTGTTLNSAAIINSSGNAVIAATSNVAVPVYIVVGGAGTSGNATLASNGTLAPCTMDSTIASAASSYFVINSPTTAGDCHAQATAPAAGTFIIGFLSSASTSSGSTALVLVDGFTSGAANIIEDTTTPITVNGSSIATYHINQNATAAQAIVYDLPTAAAGIQKCFVNGNNGSAANTGTITLQTSAAGQYIIFTDGTYSASDGYVISGGAARDSACVVGLDSTHWILWIQSGT